MWAKPPVTKRFPSQKANNAENVSIWWCYHEHRRLAGCVQYCDHLSHKPKGIMGFMKTHHCSYHVCIVELGHDWFRQWFGAEQVPQSHFLNKFEFKFFKWIDFFMYFEVKSYSVVCCGLFKIWSGIAKYYLMLSLMFWTISLQSHFCLRKRISNLVIGCFAVLRSSNWILYWL